jgi:WD40 repeat protein
MTDGRTLLASAGNDHRVRLWDPTSGTQVENPLIGHTGPMNAMAAVPLPGGRALLATASNDTARLWDTATGRLIHTFPLGFMPYALAAIGPRLAIVGDAGIVVLTPDHEDRGQQ